MKLKLQARYTFQFGYEPVILHAISPEIWYLVRFQTAKVTFRVIGISVI